jgi:hypothetical protein
VALTGIRPRRSRVPGPPSGGIDEAVWTGCRRWRRCQEALRDLVRATGLRSPSRGPASGSIPWGSTVAPISFQRTKRRGGGDRAPATAAGRSSRPGPRGSSPGTATPPEKQRSSGRWWRMLVWLENPPVFGRGKQRRAPPP